MYSFDICLVKHALYNIAGYYGNSGLSLSIADESKAYPENNVNTIRLF